MPPFGPLIDHKLLLPVVHMSPPPLGCRFSTVFKVKCAYPLNGVLGPSTFASTSGLATTIAFCRDYIETILPLTQTAKPGNLKCDSFAVFFGGTCFWLGLVFYGE